MNEEKTIIELLLKQGKEFGKKLENIETKMGNMVTQEQHSKLSIAVLDIGEKVKRIEDNITDNMVTKAEFVDSQDKVMKKLINLEAGQAASVRRDDRIEDNVNRHEVEIKNIKTQLKIA